MPSSETRGSGPSWPLKRQGKCSEAWGEQSGGEQVKRKTNTQTHTELQSMHGRDGRRRRRAVIQHSPLGQDLLHAGLVRATLACTEHHHMGCRGWLGSHGGRGRRWSGGRWGGGCRHCLRGTRLSALRHHRYGNQAINQSMNR